MLYFYYSKEREVLKMMYLFQEHFAGRCAIFTSEEKRKNFIKELSLWHFEEFNEFLDKDDFSCQDVEIDPDFNEWWNE